MIAYLITMLLYGKLCSHKRKNLEITQRICGVNLNFKICKTSVLLFNTLKQIILFYAALRNWESARYQALKK